MMKKRIVKIRKKEFFQRYFCCDIRSFIPASTRIVHAFGISIGENVIIGENVDIFQNVSIGRRWKGVEEKIVIGNNVRICSGACIIGNVTIGDNATIGANAVVLENVPNGETWAGVPAKRVGIL